jgi:hypothetical protein
MIDMSDNAEISNVLAIYHTAYDTVKRAKGQE